jgi:hypothetical protein
MTGFDFCAWCGRLTAGLDPEGDPACKSGEGCAVERTPVAKRSAGRRKGGHNRGPIVVRGQSRTLKQWAAHFGVHAASILTRAEGQQRTVAAEIDDRLEHGNPPRFGGRRRAAGERAAR